MTSQTQINLIESAMRCNALLFGSFVLKSGRISPYFFNSGLLFTGEALSALASAFAQVIIESGVEFDVIFGPAYKGISLAAITAVKLADLSDKYKNVGYAYNRKEAKDHGEGGNLVGAPLKGKRVLLLDDIITAGTAINEACTFVANGGGDVSGIVLIMDRQEMATDSTESTVQVVSKKLQVPVLSIFNLADLIKYLQGKLSSEQLAAIDEYRQKYAVV